jgi:hypothetical protein
MSGFDISPRFHPTCGARGCNPTMTELDMPLLARCVAIKNDRQTLIWFGSDLVGEPVQGTNALRDEVAAALGLRRDQVVWSTSQTHSSGALPGSLLTGSSIADLSREDPAFAAAESSRMMQLYVDGAREALSRLAPVQPWVGRGYCDSVSYNTRLPMPSGGVKFSRHHGEGLQSGKFFDKTIDLIRFDDENGKTIGAIFSFCAHPATMINGTKISPDWVGTARGHIEAALGGAPVMYCQGFCGDVNCHHIFGTPELARRTGARLGTAAAETVPNMVPVRDTPFRFAFKTIDLACQPMPGREQLEAALQARQEFIDELQYDPAATWCCGINVPDLFSASEKAAFVGLQMEYLREGLRMLERGEQASPSHPITLGAVRLGDVAFVLSPGENFTETGMNIRMRSPFAHTFICGDTNGLFGYIGTDPEIRRGGYETDSFWKLLVFGGFRLPLAEGAAPAIIDCCLELLHELRQDDLQ